MEIFDNINKLLVNDLKKTISSGARLSVAASCFSIFAFEALKKELSSIRELRFIFTSPTFIAEKMQKEWREFYIPRLNRERSLYGSDFEIKLRNELIQKSIARECADWIREKVKFRSNITNENMVGFFNIQSDDEQISYMPITGFTTSDIGLERGKNIYTIMTRLDGPASAQFINVFNAVWNDKAKVQDVTNEVLDIVENVYRENAPELIYFLTIYSIFKDFVSDYSDNLPNEATGFKNSAIWGKLYDFQKDAALGVINKLEKFNGCILADSVGLGKTFTALAIIKYYENRNKTVLVLCPKKIAGNWMTYKANYRNNPVAADRLRYDVLYHTDLSRNNGATNGLDLERLNWGNYDLVVIDESHNFRNGGQVIQNGQKENRYLRLLNQVIRTGVKTKVLMLSATPVNNRFQDLRNQLALAYEGDENQWNKKLNVKRGIADIFKNAQKSFNVWYKQPLENRTINSLLSMLDMDFFEVLDSVTIARSRKHIEKYYDMRALGKFPERLAPISLRPPLTDLPEINYSKIFSSLNLLNLEVYSPSLYIFPSRLHKYASQNGNLTQAGREEGIRRLMAINLLKRLESSVHSFRLTLTRIRNLLNSAIQAVNAYEQNHSAASFSFGQDAADFDFDDQNIDFLAQGHKLNVNLADIDYKTWRGQMEADFAVLRDLETLANQIRPERDAKLQSIIRMIDGKLENPINEGNKKILIFTAFADTAEYLYERLGSYILQKHGLHSALITGSGAGKTNIPKFKNDMNNILMNFAPLAKERENAGNRNDIDILIATDCLSEGQNLQDCDCVINYDIHWNPVRIIQRFGRIDRIGSPNEKIQLVNFWPDITLDEYINLKGRVESRMKATVLTSTGDDDLLDAGEKGDLAYRKRQLEQLQESVLDIEDISGGLSIMDLGLNEFRQDLVKGMKRMGDMDIVPHGISAVVGSTPEAPPGAIFVLRNLNEGINAYGRNRLHPYYLVYMDMEGNPVINHLEPQKLLQTIRLLCRDKTEPDMQLCKEVNQETKNGRDMRIWSRLLGDAITAMIGAKEENDVESLFHSGGTSALCNPIRGLDEFELLCFLIVR